MTEDECSVIRDFSKCDFADIHRYYKERAEERKAMSKEQKQAIKRENDAIVEEYGWCMIDGHKEKIGNFKIEPPGLFRGRGDHPKQGKIKVSLSAAISCGDLSCEILLLGRNVSRLKVSPSTLESEQKKNFFFPLLILCCDLFRGARIPQPPPGHRWREVQHDNKVILSLPLCPPSLSSPPPYFADVCR